MKILKKNQFIVYVIALMLVAAGYLNYSGNIKDSLETSLQMEANDDTKVSDIGDATLVSSNDVVDNSISSNNVGNTNTTNENSTNTVDENLAETISTTENNKNEYFSKSKLERDTMYSQMLETYEKILNSDNSLETQKQIATEEIKKINEVKNKIMICENLIKTKGFENNVIFVNGDSISVIIETDNVSQEEIAQIQNIVSRELNAQIENIHITNKQ